MQPDTLWFYPVSWLPVSEGATCLEPRLLEVTGELSDSPLLRFGADRGEAVKFVYLIDKAGRLHLARPGEALADDRIHLIAVYKRVEVDRTSWDRRRRNVKEAHLKGAACDLPGGYELCEVEVLPGLKAHTFADDIADMYPTFVASREHAIINAMAIELPANDCEHMVAYKRFAKEAKRSEGARQHREALGLDAGTVTEALTHTRGPPTKLVPCASSLVMGDLNAVDYVTGFYLAVLCRPINVYDMASRYPGVTYCTV